MRRDENGSLILEEEDQGVDNTFADADAMSGMSGIERGEYQRNKVREQDIDTFDQRAQAAAGVDDRPDWVSGPGQAISEIGKIAANNGVALITDTFDAVAAVGDLFVEGGQELVQRTTGQGPGGTWDDVFNDRDNPWTQWRRKTFRPETQSGQAINDLARGVIGTLFLVKSAPKALAKLPTKGLKGIVEAPAKIYTGGKALLSLGGLLPKLKNAAGATKAGQQVGRASQAVTSKLEPAAEAFTGLKSGLKKLQAGDRATELTKTFQRGTAAQRAAQIGSRTPELTLPLAEAAKLLSNADDIKGLNGMFQSARASAKALTTGLNAPRIRTVGEALVWDTFAAMNMAGEGDDEFDRTFGDMLTSFGLDPGFFQTTDWTDSSLDRKLKQALETAPFTFAFEGLTDLITLFRFSKNFRNASKADKNKIIGALNEQSAELAEGLSKTAPENANFMVPPDSRVGASSRVNPQLEYLYDSLQNTKQSQSNLNDLNAEQLLNLKRLGLDKEAGGELALRADESLPSIDSQTGQGLLPGASDPQLLPPGVDPGPGLLGESPQATNAQIAATRASQAPVPAFGNSAPIAANDLTAGNYGLADTYPSPNPAPVPEWPYPNGPSSPVPGKPAPVPAWRKPLQELEQGMEVAAQRPAVTPQTISAAFRDDMNKAFKALPQGMDISGSLADGVKRVQQLVPETRVDAIDLLDQNPLRFNDSGGTQVPESIWYNTIINRGLNEGWATVDPLTMDVLYVRNQALSLDRGDRSIKVAAGIDQVVDNGKYEEWLESTTIDVEAKQVPEASPEVAALPVRSEPAAIEADRQTAKAAVEVEELEITEAQRLDKAGAAAAKTGPTDDEVITENLGRLIVEMNGGQPIKPPSIEKAETGRGWVMTDENGEVIQSFTTKRAATKAAEKAKKDQADALLTRAKQLELDESPQKASYYVGDPILDSDVKGTVKLSKTQVDELLQYSDVMRREFGMNKNTFEMSMTEMYQISDGVRALIQTGEIKGNRLRVLRNILDKMETSMKLIEPIARAKRDVDVLADEASYFFNNNTFC